MAALELMTLDDGSGDFLLDDGEFVLGDTAGQDCCCESGGCCPETIILPIIADDPNATKLKIEIIDIVTAGTSCCIDPSNIGATANFDACGPSFWCTCDLIPTCISGLKLVCANNELVLSWDPGICAGVPLGFDTWELISLVCDPFEMIYSFTFTQVFPEPCEGWSLTVKITKQS